MQHILENGLQWFFAAAVLLSGPSQTEKFGLSPSIRFSLPEWVLMGQ